MSFDIWYSFIFCISSHIGLHVIVRKISGCPTWQHRASVSGKFCCMYALILRNQLEELLPDQHLWLKSPPWTKSQIWWYSSFYKMVWFLRNQYNQVCSIHEKASLTYCWKRRTSNRAFILENISKMNYLKIYLFIDLWKICRCLSIIIKNQ